jgi:alkanesulfonate monooxygenase SsuD/methylene tetrahydromethanopterin reductase-like flavin-dependent oxidoreductase (luciferase family)
VVERDPIITAKEVATLDLLSGGRFLFGIGGGWNREEMENHGTDPETRFRLMRERVLAMKAIWTQEVAEFHGDFVDFEPLWAWPKPVQQPHPPVIVGATAPGSSTGCWSTATGGCPTPAGAASGRASTNCSGGRPSRAEARSRCRSSVLVPNLRPSTTTWPWASSAACSPSRRPRRMLPLLDRYAELAAKFA